MLIYSIYKATNKTNGKVYIGFDSNWPNRKQRHKHLYINHNNNKKFYNAIVKYGWDNFEWEIVYQSKEGEYCKNVMETFFIEQYNSFKCGYNMTLGGEGTFGFNKPKTLEHSQKISRALLGKTKTLDHIENFRMSRSRNYKMIDPIGNTILIHNMAKFCRENNLNQSHMNSVCRGEYGFNSHKGYRKFIDE